MKRTKSLLALCLALVLAFSLCSGVFAAESAFPPNDFKDVKRSDWYAEAVDYAQASGIMNGVGDGKFDPSGSVTRAMVVTVLYRMAETPSVEGLKNPFNDVSNKSTNWYRDAVLWASDLGVTKGDGKADVFSPNKPITREQMAVMIFRFLTMIAEPSAEDAKQLDWLEKNNHMLKSLLAELYSDAGSISDWARVSVYFCNQSGIMQGNADGTFAPKNTLKRCECAQLFLNLYRIGEQGG